MNKHVPRKDEGTDTEKSGGRSREMEGGRGGETDREPESVENVSEFKALCSCCCSTCLTRPGGPTPARQAKKS